MTAIGFIATAIPMIISPVGLIIAGIVAATFAVIKFWDVIRPILVKTINFFIDLYNENMLFRAAINAVILSFKNFWTIGSAIFKSFTSSVKAIAKILIGAFTFNADKVKEGLSDIKDAAFGAVDDIVTGIKDNLDTALENTFTPKEKIEFVTEEGLQKGIDNITEPVKKAWKKLTGMFTFAGGAGTSTPSTTTTGTTEEEPVTEEQVTNTQDRLSKMALAWQQYSVQVQANAEMAAQAITNMVDSIIHEGIMRLGESLITGQSAFEGFGVFVLGAFASTAEQLGKMALSIGFTVDAIKAALATMSGPVAIAAGVALLALAGAARGKMKQIAANKDQVKLAKGGLAYGETLAVVGDNPNARMDPEVIAPLSKLQGMLGKANGGAVEVYGRISGQDILLSSEKAGRVRTRYRGF